MGRFLQNDFQVEQLDKGEIVDGKPLTASSGIYKTLEDLTYIANNGTSITVPVGYITDGYSKPQFTEWLVGGRFEDDIRPSTLHDYLCQYHGFCQDKTLVPLGFNKVNDLFLEAMLAVGINPLKAKIMRFAVNFNPSKW